MNVEKPPCFDALAIKIKTNVDNALGELIDNYNSPAKRLKEAMRYSLLNGGKRMRPLLASLVGELLRAEEGDILIAAMAIECIHAYSLIHDDLPAMDNDDMRRGIPTNHVKYGDATAILAGDALQTLGFEILATKELSHFGKQKRLNLIKILTKASGLSGMCAGQSIDLESTGNQISFNTLVLLHELKTGALLRASVNMASELAPNVNDSTLKILDVYANTIGLAFQVQDDILDKTGDSATMGKPQGSDDLLQKSTYISHLGLDGANEYLQKLKLEALQALERLPYNTSLLESFTHYLVNRNH